MVASEGSYNNEALSASANVRCQVVMLEHVRLHYDLIDSAPVAEGRPITTALHDCSRRGDQLRRCRHHDLERLDHGSSRDINHEFGDDAARGTR